MDKANIRAAAIEQRKSLSPDQRELFSNTIISSLSDYLLLQNDRPQNLLIYRSMRSEVATDTLLKMNDYRLFAPVTHHHEHMQWHELTDATGWQTGLFGILEPNGGPLWDGEQGRTTLLCPLTAFDRQGNRLGMGKGCFDFWLADQRKHIHQIIGLAFSCQEVSHVPAESHDIPMNCIITEKEVIQCPRG
ncbi:5-formyltetrahydrofolate cyclo-ligase [Mariprofundus micogutta]|uniref:5-formyltetrahydrofolate cyclo-ligase n=1 Tax=Mariprofundus micogutta TaxID=1921010 RepID=A0A1L8CL61_9PROT|nr:5-formyltetrahydrofolate cyclo-ligase [Mariprofundus micogutta]GAV19657.1 5-formyltetrahydrofolate cyclo-ligase [Mariprofundus micogutta]